MFDDLLYFRQLEVVELNQQVDRILCKGLHFTTKPVMALP